MAIFKDIFLVLKLEFCIEQQHHMFPRSFAEQVIINFVPLADLLQHKVYEVPIHFRSPICPQTFSITSRPDAHAKDVRKFVTLL